MKRRWYALAIVLAAIATAPGRAAEDVSVRIEENHLNIRLGFISGEDTPESICAHPEVARVLASDEVDVRQKTCIEALEKEALPDRSREVDISLRFGPLPSTTTSAARDARVPGREGGFSEHFLPLPPVKPIEVASTAGSDAFPMKKVGTRGAGIAEFPPPPPLPYFLTQSTYAGGGGGESAAHALPVSLDISSGKKGEWGGGIVNLFYLLLALWVLRLIRFIFRRRQEERVEPRIVPTARSIEGASAWSAEESEGKGENPLIASAQSFADLGEAFRRDPRKSKPTFIVHGKFNAREGPWGWWEFDLIGLLGHRRDIPSKHQTALLPVVTRSRNETSACGSDTCKCWLCGEDFVVNFRRLPDGRIEAETLNIAYLRHMQTECRPSESGELVEAMEESAA